MSIDRRGFFKGAAVAAVAMQNGFLTIRAEAAVSGADEQLLPGDALNPSGIRTAGIRMIPVVGGKYKVWTKKIGSGKVKVLLLHGGPGFTHDYLEAMESFLPQAGIEVYYYDLLGVGNSDIPDDPSL